MYWPLKINTNQSCNKKISQNSEFRLMSHRYAVLAVHHHNINNTIALYWDHGISSSLPPARPASRFWAPRCPRPWGTCRSCTWSWQPGACCYGSSCGRWKPSWGWRPWPPRRSSRCNTPGWGSTPCPGRRTSPGSGATSRELPTRAESPRHWPGWSPGDRPPACTWRASAGAHQPPRPLSTSWN